MIFTGFFIWILGLVAFLRQEHWIATGLQLLFSVFGFSMYTIFEIKNNIEKYHLKELDQVIVGFFTDLYGSIIQWIYARSVKNKKDLSFVLVDPNNIVPKNVSPEVNT
jgi:hypothetical protein